MLASTNREDILDQVNKYKCLTFKTIQLYNLYSKLLKLSLSLQEVHLVPNVCVATSRSSCIVLKEDFELRMATV